MSAEVLPTTLLSRKAIVYVRQSTQTQVQTNLESKRRQYDLAEAARHHGFTSVEVIDDDLGRSASGSMARPGFDRLVATVCAGEVGAVLCLDASRLARNGRDWHHLLELCGLVGARVIDTDGIYDPCRPNDRLLLGMKGSISEFELGVIRSRMHDGRVRTTDKHRKPFERWEAIIRDSHEGYIDWDEFERNQKLLAANAYGKAGGVKSGRGGRALLPGLLLCAGCGCRLVVAYSGHYSSPIYRCERPHQMLGRPRCLTFGAKRVDIAIGRELLLAVAPLAIEAAMHAEHRVMEQQTEQQRIVDLELQQARYDASLAERRYAACDPDNRLIAAQLEKSWEATLACVQDCEARLAALQSNR